MEDMTLVELVDRAVEQVNRTGQALRLDLASKDEQWKACGLVQERGLNVRQGNPLVWPANWKPHALP